MACILSASPYGVFRIFWAEEGYKEGGRKNESAHRMLNGDEYCYKWGDYQQITVPMKYVSSSFACDVNSLWGAGAQFAFTGNTGAGSFTARFANRSRPFDKMSKPYDNLYAGVMEVVSVD